MQVSAAPAEENACDKRVQRAICAHKCVNCSLLINLRGSIKNRIYLAQTPAASFSKDSRYRARKSKHKQKVLNHVGRKIHLAFNVEEQKLEIIKSKLTYQGAGRKPALRISKADRQKYFSKDERRIIIEINGTEFYTTLTNDFFEHVGQIRTLYEKANAVTINMLGEWVAKNKLNVGDEIYLEVIEAKKRFRLLKSIQSKV